MKIKKIDLDDEWHYEGEVSQYNEPHGKGTLTNKKNLFSKLQDKLNARKVTGVLSKRYLSRKGGYSRIIKAGFRYGDKAPMAVIEFVDRDIDAKKVDKKKKDISKPKKEDPNKIPA